MVHAAEGQLRISLRTAAIAIGGVLDCLAIRVRPTEAKLSKRSERETLAAE